ncbi:MAG TPA: hypothetical protein VK638_29030, partial [Edaphobacter sp.]|nr:hypothetical protein [Edaphobacter sp.]
MWYDVTTPNGLPQPATCNFNSPVGTCGTGGNGLFITTFTPTDTSTIATATLSLNMTGTYNISTSNVPASSS